jgi:hypothetical protein
MGVTSSVEAAFVAKPSGALALSAPTSGTTGQMRSALPLPCAARVSPRFSKDPRCKGT